MAIELRVVQFWSEIILKSFWNQAYDFRPNCTPLSSITLFIQQLNSARAKYSVSTGLNNFWFVRNQVLRLCCKYHSAHAQFIHFRQNSVDLTFHTIKKCTKIVLKPNTLIKELLTVVIKSCRYSFLSTLPAGWPFVKERRANKGAEKRRRSISWPRLSLSWIALTSV